MSVPSRLLYGSVGISNVLHVEMKTLLVGIQLCWQVGFKKYVFRILSLL